MTNTQPKPHKICLEGRPDEWPMDRLVLALVEIVRPWGYVLVPVPSQCYLLVEDWDLQPAALKDELIPRIEALEDVAGVFEV